MRDQRRRWMWTGLICLGFWVWGSQTSQVLAAEEKGTSAETEADKARADKARERVERMTRELEALRGRPMKQPVKLEVQSAEAFRAYVQGELSRTLPEDKAQRQSKAMQVFGLIPEGYELRKGLEDLYVSQAGAYYDPEKKTFFVLFGGLPDNQLDGLVLHELAHAMQDQYFDLQPLRVKLRDEPNEDTQAALSYVLEGEASYLMLLAQLKQSGLDPKTVSPELLNKVMLHTRNLDRKALLMAARFSQPKGKEGQEIRKAMEALAEVPPYLFWGLNDSYLKGQYTIHELVRTQGWPAVDGLFGPLPTSTEQMLHGQKLLPTREPPQVVPLPELAPVLGPGWKRIYANTLGEASLEAFFDQYVPKQKAVAAGGWGGDAYEILEAEGKGFLLAWQTVWDTEQDAEEFAQAMREVKKGSLGGKGAQPEPVVERRGKQVLVLAGLEKAVAKARAALLGQ